MTMKKRIVLVGLLASALATVAWCEVPLISKADLKKAKEIVIGRVIKIYQRDSVDRNPLASRDRTVNFLAELEVVRVEKGSGIKVDDVIYVHYWNRLGESLHIGSRGHHSESLKEGREVRVHLSVDTQGRREILLPNGAESIDKATDK